LPNAVSRNEVGGLPTKQCALDSCCSPAPHLYDDHFDQYYCDLECLAEYIAEHPEEVGEWYARMNVHVVDND
jgi:hypothetical protein